MGCNMMNLNLTRISCRKTTCLNQSWGFHQMSSWWTKQVTRPKEFVLCGFATGFRFGVYRGSVDWFWCFFVLISSQTMNSMTTGKKTALLNPCCHGAMALIRQSTPGYLEDDGLMNARLEAVQISVTLQGWVGAKQNPSGQWFDPDIPLKLNTWTSIMSEKEYGK